MGFDGGFQAVDPLAILNPSNDVQEASTVGHRRDLFVPVEPAAELAVECFGRTLADRRDAHADRLEGPHKVALVAGEGRFDEEDVHGGQRVGDEVRSSR